MAEPFIAQVSMWANNFAPRGWGYCSGGLLPISQNTALFSLVGTTYGGDGHTTMGLPNLNGRIPMHPGRGPGLTQRFLGQYTGIQTVDLYEAQIPSHNHPMMSVSDQATEDTPSNASYLGVSKKSTGPLPLRNVPRYGKPANLTDMSSQSVGTTGGSRAHENMQPYLAVNFCIALLGIYPSRN